MNRLVAIAAIALVACRPDDVASQRVASQEPHPATGAEIEKDVADESWSTTEVIQGRQLRRAVVYRNGWDAGNEALLVPRAEAERLHALLAGNQQLQYMCGYHWSFAFEYSDGTIAVQPFNQECERFRQHHDEIWAIVTSLWARAAAQPTHRTFRAELRSGGDLRQATEDLRSAGYIVLERLAWPGGSALVVACDGSLQDDVISQLQTTPDVATVEKFNATGYAGKPAG